MKDVLTDAGGLKIAAALQNCGDLGAYIIGLTDIAPAYKDLWIPLFRDVLGSLLSQDPETDPVPCLSIDECSTQMVQLMGGLEQMLPLFWDTLARHMLICRLIKQFKIMGNTLTYERMHVQIKSWVTSTKSTLGSIKENYARHCEAQVHQFQNPANWVIQGKQASLFNKCRDWKDRSDEGAIRVVGKKNYRPVMVVLDPDIFSQLQVQAMRRFCLPIVNCTTQNVTNTHET